MENGLQRTFEEYMPEIFQDQTVGVSDSLAKTSQSAEDKQGLLETAQACFSELCTFLDSSMKKRNPLGYSLRTLKTCLVLMEDGISPGFSLSWIGVDTMRNGKFSTQNISECLRTESGYSLSDILEKDVPAKYFVSNSGGCI